MHKITNLPSLKYDFYYPKKLRKKETHNLLLKKEIKEGGGGSIQTTHFLCYVLLIYILYLLEFEPDNTIPGRLISRTRDKPERRIRDRIVDPTLVFNTTHKCKEKEKS